MLKFFLFLVFLCVAIGITASLEFDTGATFLILVLCISLIVFVIRLFVKLIRYGIKTAREDIRLDKINKEFKRETKWRCGGGRGASTGL